MGFISALPLAGMVPMSKVLAPMFTVGIVEGGVIVVIWAPGVVVELELLLEEEVAVLLPVLLLMLLPLMLVIVAIT
jgi:hypothetical protein